MTGATGQGWNDPYPGRSGSSRYLCYGCDLSEEACVCERCDECEDRLSDEELNEGTICNYCKEAK